MRKFRKANKAYRLVRARRGIRFRNRFGRRKTRRYR